MIGAKKQRSKRAVSQESKMSSIESGGEVNLEEAKEPVKAKKGKGKKKRGGGE